MACGCGVEKLIVPAGILMSMPVILLRSLAPEFCVESSRSVVASARHSRGRPESLRPDRPKMMDARTVMQPENVLREDKRILRAGACVAQATTASEPVQEQVANGALRAYV